MRTTNKITTNKASRDKRKTTFFPTRSDCCKEILKKIDISFKKRNEREII